MDESNLTLTAPWIWWAPPNSRNSRYFYYSWLVAIIAGLLYILCSRSPPAPGWQWVVPLIIFYPLLVYNLINQASRVINAVFILSILFSIPDIFVVIWFFLTSSTTRYTIAIIWLSIPLWVPVIISVITNAPGTYHLALYIIRYAFYSCLGWRYVVRLPRWRRWSRFRTVCEECKSVLSRSSLIFGTRMVITRVVESHQIHLSRDQDCEVCCFLGALYDEIDETEQPKPAPAPPSGYGTFVNSLWSRTIKQPQSPEEGDPLLTAENDVVLKIMAESFDPIVSPYFKKYTSMAEDLNGHVDKYPDCYFQLQRGDGKMSRRVRIHRVFNSSYDPPFYNSTKSPKYIHKANDWIRNCTLFHDSCGYLPPEGGFIPNRLIQLGTIKHPQCRLVEKADVQVTDTFAYFALSHCWGGDVGVKLLRDNFDAMKQGIAADALPPNFRDAIQISRLSGAGYIWIDSLCIIQDLPADWAHESMLMTSVYANAGCTISSTASASSAGGCFRYFSPPRGECAFIGGEDGSLCIKMPKKTEVPSANLFRTRVLDAPVSQRGWVFQERLLSRRVLHFCSDIIFFECAEGQTTDCAHSVVYSGVDRPRIEFEGREYSKDIIAVVETKQMVARSGGQWNPPESVRMILSGVPDALIKLIEEGYYKECSISRGIRSAFAALKSARKDLLTHDEGMMEFNRLWYELVSSYSAGGLTLHTDRLVAIAGIATVIEEKTDVPYLAGLWDQCALEFGLLWRAESPRAKEAEYCAPSWSWAAVNGHVTLLPDFNMSEVDVEIFAKVTRAITTLHGERVTTAASLIDGGEIEIEGQTVDVTILQDNEVLHLLGDGGPLEVLSFYPDNTNSVSADSKAPLPSDASKECPTKLLKALLVARTRRRQGSPPLSYGLVLAAKSASDSSDEYERVGVFEASGLIETDSLAFGRVDSEVISRGLILFLFLGVDTGVNDVQQA